MHHDERHIEQVCVHFRDFDPSGIWSHEHRIVYIDMGAQVIGEQRNGRQVDHLDVKETLNGG